jgi:hypothetical protein
MLCVGQWAESQLLELRAHLEGLLEDRRASLQASLDAVNERVARLEAQFEEDKAATMREIDARNRELTAKLEDFQAAFEAERKDRMEREGRIQTNLSRHEHETGVHFEEERVRREPRRSCVPTAGMPPCSSPVPWGCSPLCPPRVLNSHVRRAS